MFAISLAAYVGFMILSWRVCDDKWTAPFVLGTFGGIALVAGASTL